MFRLKSFRRCESGATAIEYALIAVLIAVAIITSVTALGAAVRAKYVYIANGVSSAH